MTKSQKRIFGLLLAMAAAAFVVFGYPNAAGSKNISMVQIFQPDESVILPYIFHMIGPAPSMNQALRQFVFYEYYFYGFPFFAASALVLLPIQWLGQLGNMSLVMLSLRQVISVLPMLVALLLLVFLVDGFRTYRSPVIFALLLAVPAVVQNNSWYHPDGITFLLVVLTLFFLVRDNLRFGPNFVYAAVMCGVATAVKLVGLYFFLAVGLTLVLGFITRKVSWKRLAIMAVVFIIAMAISYVVANPFLLSHWARTAYFQIESKQGFLLENGYGVVYPKGLLESWPLVHTSYGEAVFLLIGLGVTIWGAFRGPNRLLYGLILAWFIPLSVTVFFLTHFKFQYWMPVALPLISSVVILLPEKWSQERSSHMAWLVRVVLMLIVLVQFGIFISADSKSFVSSLNREQTSTSIKFFNTIRSSLSPLPDQGLHVYYDYRLYVPGNPGWKTETTYDLLDYGYIQHNDFDALVLLEQRIKDYLNPNAVGTNPDTFPLNQQFYRAADNESITGYDMVYRDPFALIFVRDALYKKYYSK